MRLQNRKEIDGLRAIAVLAVVAFHLDIVGLSGGFAGVDIFFVISGYLITRLIRSDVAAGTFRFSEFYARRARRLFPAMFVAVFVTFVVGAFVMSPVAFENLSFSALAATLSVSNITFWLQSGYFDESNWTKPLLHTWSLGVEEQFYLLWPAAVVFLIGFRRKFVAPAAICVAGITSLVLAEIWLQFSPEAAFFLLPFRICEFALGAILVWAPANSAWPNWLKEAGFAAGAAAIGTTFVLFDSDTRFPGVAGLLPCAGAALCIYFGQSFAAQLALANAPAVAIGRISYSLYLVHWPIIIFAKYYLLRELAAVEAVLAFLLSVVLAVLLYHYIEQPFRGRMRNQKFARPWRVSAVIVICVTLFAAPAISAQFDGWRWRLPKNATFTKSFELEKTNYGGLDCKETYCESTGDPAHPKVFVIGDSHARGLYAGLVRAFPKVNFVFFVPDACGFYSAGFYASYAQTGEDCRSLRQQAFAEIAESNSPVIIFQLWRSYVRLRHVPVNGRGPAFQTKQASVFAVFAAAQIEKLKSQLGNRSIIIVGGVPTFANVGSPEDCFSRPLQRPPCATSPRRTVVDRVNADFNSAIAAIPNKTFLWLDPFRYLCDQSHCRNMTPDGKTIYVDEDHLSIWGSEYLVSLFRPIIARELAGIGRVRPKR